MLIAIIITYLARSGKLEAIKQAYNGRLSLLKTGYHNVLTVLKASN